MASSATAGVGHGDFVLPAPTVRCTSGAPDDRGAPARNGIAARRSGACGQWSAPAGDPPAAVPPHAHRKQACPAWLSLPWERFQRSVPPCPTDAGEGPSAKELNQLDGADPALTALLVAEMRDWRALTDNPDLSSEERDDQLQALCAEATMREVGPIEPVSARLTAASAPADPLLGVVRVLPPPPPAGIPKAECLYAFAAAVAPHAGARLSRAWLSAHIGPAVAAGGRVFQSPSASSVCLASALVQWGSTLYVGVAGARWDDWDSLLRFFSSPLVKVSTRAVMGGVAMVPGGLPHSVAVNADAWAACKELHSVLVAVAQALTPRPPGDKAADGAEAASPPPPASRVVFCGHGAAAAVATLLALQYPQHVAGHPALPCGPPSVATYGCPLMGDAALATLLRTQLPANTRWYVDHDPVAGLPRWSTVGLRFSPPAREAAPAACRAHRALSPDGVGHPGVAGAPRVASLAVAGVGYRTHHRLDAYALCLTRLWEGRGVGSGGPPTGTATGGGLRRLWHRLVHVPPPVKGHFFVSGGGGTPRNRALMGRVDERAEGKVPPAVDRRAGRLSTGALPPTSRSSSPRVRRPSLRPLSVAPRTGDDGGRGFSFPSGIVPRAQSAPIRSD